MAENQTNHEERRNFVRVRADMVLNFRIFCTMETESTEIENAEIQNISEGGLMFVSNQSLVLGQNIEVRLSVPNSPEPLQFEGRVVWNRRTTGKKITYNSGIEIIEIAPEARKKLKEALTAKMSK